ncbi:hypothetical protein [Paraburkholderia hospita]|uniref:hypothetical protein n=1 Tax=Paraburkholderia hospita TaxID=169430 RepID=UPI0008A778F9|nr:hypothetical protein [Paraburkholderia hospita]SEH89720.1 hypothetical protein SAMN05192544_1011143 [Paraburkholderia hospita]
MKIECTLQRKGGTVVELGGKTYHFKPTDDDPRHVAEVENEAHIERFLSIREAYRLPRKPGAEAVEETLEPIKSTAPTPAPAAPPAVTLEPGQFLKTSGATFPPSFDIGGTTYTLDEITHHAFGESGLTVEDWNGLDEEHRSTKIEIVLDALEAGEIAVAKLPPKAPELPNETAQDDAKQDGAAPLFKGEQGDSPQNGLPAPDSDAEKTERAVLDAVYKERFGKLPPSNMKIETLRAKLAGGQE